ncbi:MAG: hypothetical protein ACREBG_29560 [Pyrinomonadaceae bacterium]
MTVIEHNKILAIGFAVFAAVFAFTILLLLVISFGVFVALGISFANETHLFVDASPRCNSFVIGE